MILASNADVIIASIDVFLVSLSTNQMRCVTFSFRENFHVVNLHWVLVGFSIPPRENVALTFVNVGSRNARQIAIVDFTFQH